MKQIKVKKNQAEEIKGLIIELYEHDSRVKLERAEQDKKKQTLVTKIKNFMFTHGFENGVKFNSDTLCKGKTFVCKKITPTSVIWDANKVREKLDKEMSDQFLDKNIEITNWDGVVKLLKAHGVKPKEFMKNVSVDYKVNTKKLEQLEALGVISIEDLKGCYDLKESNSYLKISLKEDVGDEGEQSI